MTSPTRREVHKARQAGATHPATLRVKVQASRLGFNSYAASHEHYLVGATCPQRNHGNNETVVALVAQIEHIEQQGPNCRDGAVILLEYE